MRSSWIPLDRMPGLEVAVAGRYPIRVLRDLFGVPLLTPRLLIEVVTADEAVAMHLGIAEDAALLLSERMIHTEDGLPVEFGFTVTGATAATSSPTALAYPHDTRRTMRRAVTGGLVFDGESFTPSTVHVDGERIVGVDTVAPSAAEEAVDATGLYLVPGLIDAHYHLVSRSSEHPTEHDLTESMLEGIRNAEDTLASGVTTVRDCGCRTIAIYSLQAGIRDGMACGPDSVAAGRNPTGRAAPVHWRNVVADGPAGMRAAVRSQVDAGAQWVKLILAHAESPIRWDDVTVFMSDEEIAAAVDEAHGLGDTIGAHCEGWEVAERAVRLGLDSLDHAPLLSDAAVAGMAERQMTYTPSLWAFSDDSGIDLDGLPDRERESVLGWREEHRRSVRRALAAGVPIAAGSDSASTLTGKQVLARELAALVDAGLTPRQALTAATVTGAALIGRDGTLGRIALGFQADLVALPTDPLADIDAVRTPAWVRQRGELRFVAGHGIVPPSRATVAIDEVVARW